MTLGNLDDLVRIGQLRQEPPRAEELAETERNLTGDFEAIVEVVEA